MTESLRVVCLECRMKALRDSSQDKGGGGLGTWRISLSGRGGEGLMLRVSATAEDAAPPASAFVPAAP
jgi:hypothetical protein